MKKSESRNSWLVQICPLEHPLYTSNPESKFSWNFTVLVIQQNQFYSIGPTSLILNLNMVVLFSWYEILLFRLPDHGQQDLELLRLKDQSLLRVFVDQRRLDVLRLLPKVWRKLQALDVSPRSVFKCLNFRVKWNIWQGTIFRKALWAIARKRSEGSPRLVVMGRDSFSRGRGFEFQHWMDIFHIFIKHFLSLRKE